VAVFADAAGRADGAAGAAQRVRMVQTEIVAELMTRGPDVGRAVQPRPRRIAAHGARPGEAAARGEGEEIHVAVVAREVDTGGGPGRLPGGPVGEGSGTRGRRRPNPNRVAGQPALDVHPVAGQEIVAVLHAVDRPALSTARGHEVAVLPASVHLILVQNLERS